jgi:hypothetical protein
VEAVHTSVIFAILVIGIVGVMIDYMFTHAAKRPAYVDWELLMERLRVERISKYFLNTGTKSDFCVFKDLSPAVGDREFVSVLGHSGCGKSTMPTSW